MQVSTGQGSFLTSRFDLIFLLINSKSERKKLWGSEWELPVFITMGLIKDIKNGINILNPSKEDLMKSATIKVASTFTVPREQIESYITSC